MEAALLPSVALSAAAFARPRGVPRWAAAACCAAAALLVHVGGTSEDATPHAALLAPLALVAALVFRAALVLAMLLHEVRGARRAMRARARDLT